MEYCTRRETQSTRYGFRERENGEKQCTYCTGITAVDLPDDTTVILRVNEATLLGEKANTLLSPTQIRENGHIIDERARKHGGKGCITADGYVIPMTLREGMMAIKIRKPTPKEEQECTTIDLTSDFPYEPGDINEVQISPSEYTTILRTIEEETGERVNYLKKIRDEPYDLDKIAPYLLHPGNTTVMKTLEATSQLGKMVTKLPLQSHTKSKKSTTEYPKTQ